jgi:selenocysteine lyase/cysteine desulfurase
MPKPGEMTRRRFMEKFAATGTGILTSARLPSMIRPSRSGKSEQNATSLAAPAPDFAAVRADFPRAEKNLWLAAAETHPFNVNTLRAVENYCQYRALGPGEGRKSFTPEMQNETKRMFADLIGAKPEEIAFTMSTTDGENIVIAGIDLARKGGNVVIDDLHFIASKWMYGEMQKKGQIELRVVRHRDWTIRLEDMARAIDKNTRLVSMALVSNVNGYMHDARAISDLAHAQGALVYGDIIQGVGNTPLDVRAMGLDCAASSTYKWLMGDFGLGFLYVREDLQENVVKQTRYGARQIGGVDKNGAYTMAPGAARYEGTTTMPYLPGICAYEGLKYVTKLGVENIRAHAKPLTDRLQKEMPSLGFTSITPIDSPTPIVSFIAPDIKVVEEKLKKAFPQPVVSMGHWEKTDDLGKTEAVSGIRIAVSVYNNDADIDKFLNALSSS